MTMPRGVKGSGKPKTSTKAKKAAERVVEPVVEIVPVEKARKSYPTREERIAIADKQIERLTKLNAARAALIEKTEKTLAERKEALSKSTTALEKVLAKKEHILAIKEKVPKTPKVKLTPEERKERMAAGRAAKKAEREQLEALAAAVKASGKSVDELIAEIKSAE